MTSETAYSASPLDLQVRGFKGWTVDEALKWAAAFGTWKGDPPDGDALALDALAKEIMKLRAALRISTNGLRHCARWNISEEKATALMAVVMENETLLTPNVEVTGVPAAADKQER